MDHLFDSINSDDHKTGTCYLQIPERTDEVGSILEIVDPLLSEQILHKRMSSCAYLVKYHIKIGSTIAS